MSEAPSIARLQQVPVREAWPDEARKFTPWLYENLDVLGDAIGVTLEGEGTEVPIESFSADILARNRYDDSRVLIENQLEGSNHTHLGQIMTYLAGLDAKTIVWVATEFRPAHLSALKWLNDHTEAEFSFFAVKVKVVQIAGPPFAPIFEVVERPNEWERQLHNAAKETEVAEYSKHRKEFWQAFVDSVPGELERSGPALYVSNRWRELPEYGVVISLMLAKRKIGIFYRSRRGGDFEELRQRLSEKADELATKLGVSAGLAGTGFYLDAPGDYTDPAQRDQLIKWLAEKADLYETTYKQVFDKES